MGGGERGMGLKRGKNFKICYFVFFFYLKSSVRLVCLTCYKGVDLRVEFFFFAFPSFVSLSLFQSWEKTQKSLVVP